MSDPITPPATPPDLRYDRLAVHEAQEALRIFGGSNLDHATAIRLLRSWVHDAALSERERIAILQSFPIRTTE